MNKQSDHSLTLSELVNRFTDALESALDCSGLDKVQNINVDKFVDEQNLPTFIHLTCNQVLLSQSRHIDRDYEELLEGSLQQGLEKTNWFIPASLALIELRFANETLNNLTKIEKKAIRQHYGLGRLPDQGHLEYHQSGTTSIIFVSNNQAIKIVRPVYLLDKEVASLDKYRDSYAGAPLSPKVYWAESTVLCMEWIRGDTLEQYLEKAKDNGDIKSKLSIIKSLGQMIREIHEKGFPHGDLNPRNIIVEAIAGHDQNLRLIDYGYNYSLTKPVLSAQSYRDSVRYIAPAKNDMSRDAYSDDLYSTAVIILDVWFRDLTRAAEDLLHELAIVQPLLAFTLEDVLVNDPDLRLRKIAPQEVDPACRAEQFSKAIQMACSQRAQFTRAAEKKITLVRLAVSGFWTLLLRGKENIEDGFVLDEDTNKKLRRWLWICGLCFGGILAAISTILVYSFSEKDTFWSGLALRDWWFENSIGLTKSGAGFWDILPGLAICLSFACLATTYYVAIFQSTAPQKSAGFGSGAANFTMRLNSCCFAFPIAYCFILDPKAWPFCAALGLMLVALNNFFTFRMLEKIKMAPDFGKLAISRSSDAETSYIVFSGWASLVFWYALGIILVGIVLITSSDATNSIIDKHTGDAVSYNIYEYLLAFCVIGINYFKMQRENCGRLAPKMEALIQRYIEASKALK
ncbi:MULTISPECIES: AarF/UbiB family protein [unclassified Ruegeria]|uniref:protein kinase domain-containing protein n=1 Tax=unclassified Ruegeria TaxID=2625375 RepID=UPI001489238F|nr:MULTISPECIES: AarF/UbiB family protein [unclassified Ruegeria]NOD35611.1 protein kinase [Ruegeria sp. HKCCD7296]NOE42977.1 protein kinase [Ruegeria sp. HKCCD7319]